MAGLGRTSRHGRTFVVRVCMAAALLVVSVSMAAIAAAATPDGYSLQGRRFSRAMRFHSSLQQAPGVCQQLGCSGSCCNGVCVDVSRSVHSCGACNNPCAFNRDCCSGVCVDTHDSDPLNCGSCGRACSQGVPCLFGMCGYSSGRVIIP